MKNLPTPREKSLDQADLEEDDAWPGNSWVNLAIPMRFSENRRDTTVYLIGDHIFSIFRYHFLGFQTPKSPGVKRNFH